MDPVRFHALLQKHLPAAAVSYCFRLWQQFPFEFKLRKKRISKVGDFTCHHGQVPRITINHDSHPYLFLITYVHEVAHLVVHQRHGWKIESHGEEWKEAFRQLMFPVLSEEIFPSDLLKVLRAHMLDPKASSFSDTFLTHALRRYDENQKSVTLLSELPEGTIFAFHGRWFKKGVLKRTRVLCREVNTRRNYLVPNDVPVETEVSSQ